MMSFETWRRPVAAIAACAALLLAGCNTPPTYQVSDQPAARVGTVESIQTQTQQNVPNAVGAIGGALIGGGLGSLIGGGHRQDGRHRGRRHWRRLCRQRAREQGTRRWCG